MVISNVHNIIQWRAPLKRDPVKKIIKCQSYLAKESGPHHWVSTLSIFSLGYNNHACVRQPLKDFHEQIDILSQCVFIAPSNESCKFHIGVCQVVPTCLLIMSKDFEWSTKDKFMTTEPSNSMRRVNHCKSITRRVKICPSQKKKF